MWARRLKKAYRINQQNALAYFPAAESEANRLPIPVSKAPSVLM